ncbi:MAG: MFS transporter [Pleomorphochaeta sp.]
MKQDSKQLLFLSLVSFFAQMIIASVNLSLVYYLNDVMNYSASTIAITVSSFSISYVVFCLLLEKPTNSISPRLNIYISLFGMGVFILLFLNSNSFSLILICLILYGAFMALLWPHMASWYSRGRENEKLNRAISFFNLSWGLGVAFSSIICGVLTEINVMLPLIVSIISFIILSVIVFFMTSRIPYLKAVESEKKYNEKVSLVDKSTPLRYFSWIAVFLAYFFFGMFINIFPLYAKNDLLINETRIGFLLWSKGIISCLAFYYLGKMSFWHFKSFYIIACQIILAILCFITAMCTSYLAFFLSFMIFGLVFSLMYLQSIFHGVSGALNRTKRMTIHEVVLTSGLVFGSIISGYIYEHLGFSNALFSFGILMLIVIVIEIVFFFFVIKRD